MEFVDFLVEAKKATYASENRIERVLIERVLEDGTKELLYEKDNFAYRDRYYGSSQFSGREIIWQNNKPIWAMNYFGGMLSNEIDQEKTYQFLRKALRNVERKHPFRGPKNFLRDSFRYSNNYKKILTILQEKKKYFLKIK